MIKQTVCTIAIACLVSVAGGRKAVGSDGTASKKQKRPPANWLRGSGPSGHEKAIKLQEETGLDMLLLFYRDKPSNEKGLMSWFEKKGMNQSGVIKQMRGYVKVKIDAARSDKRTRALVKEYKVGKTPRLVIRQPNGWVARVKVFDWPGGEPKLASHQDIIQRLKDASSPSYREDDN